MKTSFFPTLTKQHLGLQLCRKQQLCSTSGTILAKSDTFCQQTIKGKQRCFVSHFKRKSGNGQRKRNNKVHTLQRNKTTGARLRLTGLTLGIENCSTRLRLTLQSKDSALLFFFFYICISRWRKRIDGLSVWDVVTPVALPPVNCRERGQTHKHRSSACSFFFFCGWKRTATVSNLGLRGKKRRVRSGRALRQDAAAHGRPPAALPWSLLLDGTKAQNNRAVDKPR